MAFRKKANCILHYNPDILIVPECEHPDKLKFDANTPKPNDVLWFGANQNKGLGIFSYADYTFQLLDIYNPEFKLIIPIKVSKGKIDFILFAIWANHPEDPDGQYVEQIWKAIHYYTKHINSTKTVLAGDFNSNSIWDKPRRKSNHSNVVKHLAEKGIYSSYHLYHNQTQGKEQDPTLYMYRHKDKPYHIDYCFVSKDLAKKLKSVEVGEYDQWIQYSDHVPMIVTFNL